MIVIKWWLPDGTTGTYKATDLFEALGKVTEVEDHRGTTLLFIVKEDVAV